jgi:hypothetical protein
MESPDNRPWAENGRDEKIIALPLSKLTTIYDNIADVADLPEIQVERLKHFFAHYKDLEPKPTALIFLRPFPLGSERDGRDGRGFLAGCTRESAARGHGPALRQCRLLDDEVVAEIFRVLATIAPWIAQHLGAPKEVVE